MAKSMATKTNAKTTTNTSITMIRIVIHLCNTSMSFYVMAMVNEATIEAPIKCNSSNRGSQVAVACAIVRIKSPEVSKKFILTRNSYAACLRPITVSAVNHLNPCAFCFLRHSIHRIKLPLAPLLQCTADWHFHRPGT